MALRETAGSALGARSLRHDANHEAAPDVLGALSQAPALGRALWRFVYAGQEESARDVVYLLTLEVVRRYRWYPDVGLAMLVTLAILEWAHGQCTFCDGRKGYMLGPVWLPCPVCRGTGIRRHSNRARRAYVGAWSTEHTRRLHRMLDILTTQDGLVLRILQQQLDRAMPVLLANGAGNSLQSRPSDIRRGGPMAVKPA